MLLWLVLLSPNTPQNKRRCLLPGTSLKLRLHLTEQSLKSGKWLNLLPTRVRGVFTLKLCPEAQCEWIAILILYSRLTEPVVVFFLFVEVLFKWLPLNSLDERPALVFFIIE